MKDFLELAKNRYSCRNYKADKIEDAVLNYVLECGRIAPSAVNFQPWKFLVCKSKESLNKAKDCYHRDWINSAPCVIIVCVNHEQSWKRKHDEKDHADIDAAIAYDHMTLAATEKGLATCWVCNFDVELTMETFNLPENMEPVALMPIGYPIDQANPERHAEKRKAINEIVEFL